MSERYSKLFNLPKNLYAADSPVLIAAGALLKDNQTGNVLAQLKIRNIGTKNIKAAKVCIRPLDTAGTPLGEEIKYQYLDLSVWRDEDFGTKSPITLPDATTRSYSVYVAELVFADNSVWKSTDEPWEALSAPLTLETTLRNQELINQYRIKFGADCKYEPAIHKNLWYCACGGLNHKEESVCHRCKKSLTSLLSVDLESLKQECNARVAAEQQKAIEEKAVAEVKAKKTKKLAMIIVLIAVVLSIAVELISNIVKKNQEEAARMEAYNSAVELIEDSKYDEAIAAFTALNGYKDSVTKIEEAQVAKRNAEIEAQYQEAMRLLEAGEYSSAKSMFEALDGYQDSQSYIQKCEYGIVYLQGVKEESSDIAVALETYQTIPSDFLDVSDRIATLSPLVEFYGTYYLQHENAYFHQKITIVSIFYENNSLQITYIHHFKSSESVTKSLETTDKEGVYLIEDFFSEKYSTTSIFYLSAGKIETVHRSPINESTDLYIKKEN